MMDKMLIVEKIASTISNSCCDISPIHNCELPCSECLAVSIYDRVFTDNVVILSKDEYDTLVQKTTNYS